MEQKWESGDTLDQRVCVCQVVYSRYGAVFAPLSLLGSTRAHGGCVVKHPQTSSLINLRTYYL